VSKKHQRRPASSRPALTLSPRGWAIVAILAAAATIGLVVWLARQPESITPTSFAVGDVAYCRISPQFAKAMGYTESSILSTASRQKGLVIFDPPASADGEPVNVYQHPTWDDAGYLSAPVTDKFGNIYVAPSPRVSLLDNPPEQQNTIYKVDTEAGVMAELIKLPAAAPLSPDNPFGILGLAYDCDTHSLYASSVAGSTRTKEAGRIIRIDLSTREIASQFENTDAFGLDVFNGTTGKRLYFGAARASEVRSVPLDAKGDFTGKPRVEFSMAGLGAEGDEKARRIIFNSATMLVRGMEFEFNLIATSERQQTEYQLRYDTSLDAWKPLQNYGP